MRRTSPTCQRTLSKTPVAPMTTRNSRQQMGSVQWRSTFGPGFPRRCNKSSASAEEPQHLEQEAMAGWCTVSRDAVPLLCCGWCYGFSNFLTAGLKMAETAAVSIKVYSWCLRHRTATKQSCMKWLVAESPSKSGARLTTDLYLDGIMWFLEHNLDHLKQLWVGQILMLKSEIDKPVWHVVPFGGNSLFILNFEWYNENWCDPPGKLHPN